MHTHRPPRHHVNLRLERWHRRSIYACFAALTISGALWLVARYFMRPINQFGESIHPLEPLAMKFHGGAAMVMLFFLGSLMNAHIRRAIKARHNLGTGWSMIVTMLVLIASGFGLYYIAGEGDRSIWSLLHWLIGLGSTALFVVHVALGRTKM
jgi:hypothetical protein